MPSILGRLTEAFLSPHSARVTRLDQPQQAQIAGAPRFRPFQGQADVGATDQKQSQQDRDIAAQPDDCYVEPLIETSADDLSETNTNITQPALPDVYSSVASQQRHSRRAQRGDLIDKAVCRYENAPPGNAEILLLENLKEENKSLMSQLEAKTSELQEVQEQLARSGNELLALLNAKTLVTRELGQARDLVLSYSVQLEETTKDHHEDKIIVDYLNEKLAQNQVDLHHLAEEHDRKRTKQHAIAQQSLQAKQQELLKAQKEIAKLLRSLEECKETIFNMQPVQPVTDDKICIQYETLLENLTDWVLDEFGELEQTVPRLSKAPLQGLWKSIVQTLIGPETCRIAVTNPAADLNVLCFFIFSYIHHQLLANYRTFPDMTEDIENFMLAMVDGIKLLEPKRNVEAYSGWVAEMYRIVAKLPNFSGSREVYLDSVSRNILDLMIHLLPFEKRKDFKTQQFLDAVDKAAQLALNIRTSPTTYSFVHHFKVKDTEGHRIMLAAELKDYTVVDAATGHILRPVSTPVADVNGRIGVKICVIFPALCRTGSDREKQITLLKSTILVKFDHPIPKSGKRKVPGKSDPNEIMVGNTDHGKSLV